VKCMRLTLDPIRVVHRPLLWYIVVAAVDTMTYLRLITSGFRHYSNSRLPISFPLRPLTIFSRRTRASLPFWYRPHRSETKLPILFLHGIGIGLHPYVPFLQDLIAQDPEVGIVAIEFLPLSSRITGPVLSRSDNCLAISEILISLNISRVVVASHSYGTIVASHLLRSSAFVPDITATLFIDPIPFLLHLPNVAFNFVYRSPRMANEWQLWYFASRDPDVSRALSRNFFWTENIMWKDELEGHRVAVALSGDDQIVPSEAVRRYLTGEAEMQQYWSKDGLEVLFYPGIDHATIFDTIQRRASLVEILDRFVLDT